MKRYLFEVDYLVFCAAGGISLSDSAIIVRVSAELWSVVLIFCLLAMNDRLQIFHPLNLLHGMHML